MPVPPRTYKTGGAQTWKDDDKPHVRFDGPCNVTPCPNMPEEGSELIWNHVPFETAAYVLWDWNNERWEYWIHAETAGHRN